jgi:uncharacterized protein (DUF4415 family)
MAIVKSTLDPKNPPPLPKGYLEKLRAMKDEDIDYSDIPDTSQMLERPQKRQLTIRLDDDVLAWVKAKGKGYQTRINFILRAVMESKPKLVRRKPAAAKKRAAISRRTA